MKKVLKIFGIAISALLIIGLASYFFFIRPIILEESSLKSVLLNSANLLMNCSLNDKEIAGCYKIKTSDAFKKIVNIDQYAFLMKKIKLKLGSRISSELIDEKFNLTVFKGTNSSRRVNFIVKAAYQNDLFATESYVFSLDDRTNEYKLDSVYVNSDKLLE